MNVTIDQNALERVSELLFAITEGFVQVFPSEGEEWTSPATEMKVTTTLIQEPTEVMLNRLGPSYRFPIGGSWLLVIEKANGRYGKLLKALSPQRQVFDFEHSIYPVGSIENNLYEQYGADAYNKVMYLFNNIGRAR
jgi:hypothetical protein